MFQELQRVPKGIQNQLMEERILKMPHSTLEIHHRSRTLETEVSRESLGENSPPQRPEDTEEQLNRTFGF